MKESKGNRSEIQILIDDRYCKGCHICLEVCSQKVFLQGEWPNRSGYRIPRVSNPEACSGCRLCEMACPDLALTVLEGKQ